jgi:hypothetical protein
MSQDDLASALERILEEGPADADPAAAPTGAAIDLESPPPPAATGAPEPPAPAPASADVDTDALLRGVRREVVYELDELRGQLDAAFEEVVGRINRLELRLSALRAAVGNEAEASDAVRSTTADTLALLRQVAATLDDAVASASEPSDRPFQVDMRHLEEATREGSLRNAADIANLAKVVDGLVVAVQHQEKGIAELGATLEWIKQRLLSR